MLKIKLINIWNRFKSLFGTKIIIAENIGDGFIVRSFIRGISKTTRVKTEARAMEMVNNFMRGI